MTEPTAFHTEPGEALKGGQQGIFPVGPMAYLIDYFFYSSDNYTKERHFKGIKCINEPTDLPITFQYINP